MFAVWLSTGWPSPLYIKSYKVQKCPPSELGLYCASLGKNNGFQKVKRVALVRQLVRSSQRLAADLEGARDAVRRAAHLRQVRGGALHRVRHAHRAQPVRAELLDLVLTIYSVKKCLIENIASKCVLLTI